MVFIVTLFLLLLHHFHLRSSGIRSRRLGTPALKNRNLRNLRNLVFLQRPNSQRAWGRGRMWGWGEGASSGEMRAGRQMVLQEAGERETRAATGQTLQHSGDSRGCRGDCRTARDMCGSSSHTAAVAACRSESRADGLLSLLITSCRRKHPPTPTHRRAWLHETQKDISS